MADSQTERIEEWARKQKIFRVELEAFKVAFNTYQDDRSIIAIQYYLKDLEKDFMSYMGTQYELDDMDNTEIMQEHVKLKEEYYNCKKDSLYIVNNGCNKTKQEIKKKKSRCDRGWGLHDTWGTLEPSEKISSTGKAVDKHLTSLFNITCLQRTSYEDLQSYVKTIKTHYNALKAFRQPTVDTILVHLFASKVDQETRRNWKFMTKYASFPDVDDFIDFLYRRRYSIEYLESVRRNPKMQQFASLCVFCNEYHKIWKCEVFKQKSFRERNIAIFELSVCANCLNRGHAVRNCTALSFCRICGKRHHTLLHRTKT
jgi:hypothetical protein